MFHVKHFLLCDLARRRKGFFTSRFTGNRTVGNCGSGWPKRRNHRKNGRWQGVPRAGNVSREHGKISLSEAALGRSGARSVHAGAAGKKDCPEQDTDQSISSRLEEKCFTWNMAKFYGSCSRGQDPARAAPCRRARQSVLAQTAQPEGDGFGGAAASFLARPMMAVMDFLGQSMRDSVR